MNMITTSQATSRGRKVRMYPDGQGSFTPLPPTRLTGGPTMNELILAKITEAGDHGMTCDEIEIELGLRHQTASGRLWDLVGRGLLRKTTATREARSGKKVRIYVLNRGPA